MAAIVVVAAHMWKKSQARSRMHSRIRGASVDSSSRRTERTDDLDDDVILDALPGELEEQIIEIVDDHGQPAFKFRFRADLSFTTPTESLQKHQAEAFITRPNGNRDIIEEDGGWWQPVSRWERPEWRNDAEDERFKYIGGTQVYIDFLLSIRAVYEDRTRSPNSKRNEIERICGNNHHVYTVRHVYRPPWETLIVPVFSLAEGFGQHRISLLYAAGIKSIHDVEIRSDQELLGIKGIGKAAVSSLRSLASHWPYDKFTDCIENDERYR